MASATAIPNRGQSSHHSEQQDAAAASGASTDTAKGLDTSTSQGQRMSYSPTNTSPPRGIISPIYTQAGRSAFSMPGPNSSSTSPTTTSWYSAGFAASNSQRVRSPQVSVGGFGSGQQQGGEGTHSRGTSASGNIQRDYFGSDASNMNAGARHFRTSSFSSGTSSISSADLEPLTPSGMRGPGAAGTASTEQAKAGAKTQGASQGRRESWAFAPPMSATSANGPLGAASANRWTGGLGNLRDRAYPPPSTSADLSGSALDTSAGGASGSANQSGMSSLFRKLSFGASARSPPQQGPPSLDAGALQQRGRSESVPIGTETSNATPAPAAPAPVSHPPKPSPSPSSARHGRSRTVAGSGSNVSGPGLGSQRRRPSPMGERLLMGHFSGH